MIVIEEKNYNDCVGLNFNKRSQNQINVTTIEIHGNNNLTQILYKIIKRSCVGMC